MPAITPSLWFDGNLEDAAEFYTPVFPNSPVEILHRTTAAGPGEPGKVLSGFFVLELTTDPEPARAAAAAATTAMQACARSSSPSWNRRQRTRERTNVLNTLINKPQLPVVCKFTTQPRNDGADVGRISGRWE
jgi:3-demethylubiquinone-9 3-methyltransferase